MQRVKEGDIVEVISGKDRGVRGEVIRVIPKKDRVVVERVNILKKHQSPQQTGGRNVQAGIIEFEGPIHLSNVMVVCPSCGARTRVGFQTSADGYKSRICRKCDGNID